MWLSFKVHTLSLVKKRKITLGFYYRNKGLPYFISILSGKHLHRLLSIRVMDYGDIISASQFSQVMSNSLSRMHHCVLSDLVSWFSLRRRKQQHWYILLSKPNHAISYCLPTAFLILVVLDGCSTGFRGFTQNLVMTPVME